MTISNSNINIKKDKKTNNEKKKNISCTESIKGIKKNNKSLSNIANNYTYQEKINNNNNKTPSNLLLKMRKSSNPNISVIQKTNNINSKIKKMLYTNNNNNNYDKHNEPFSNILSNTFINNNIRINNSLIQDKYMTQNKSTKNKVIIKRNKKNNNNIWDNKDISKFSYDISRINEFYQNNKCNNDNTMRSSDGELGSKSKKITEMKNGLNKIFNNFLGQKNNILNTNYIINKRCRIINNKNKKNMSMNLSRFFSNYNKKVNNKSPKYNIKINISNNNIDNINFKDNSINSSNKNNNKNNIILLNNKQNNFNKINQHTIFNSQNQSILRKYNTNIKSSRILNSISSNSRKKKRKKIITIKSVNNHSKNNSSLKKRKTLISKYKDINNSSNSIIINDKNDKINPLNDYSLKILDQYYTINNTINITNNNSMLNNYTTNNISSNNMSTNMSNIKNYKNKTNYTINNTKDFIKYLYKCIDKDNNGFIILNYKQIMNIIINFNKNNNKIYISKEFCGVLKKMIKILYEINKKNNNTNFDEDKIIITENLFIKYMIYIYSNKLNTNEKQIFLSSKNNINNSSMPYNYKPKSSYNGLKTNRSYLFSYNYSNRLYHTREYKSISNDINNYFLNKMRKSASRKKSKFNSFNDL